MARNNWKDIGARRKRGGILAPLFSVYSKNSVGIGDLGDLKLLIDLCHNTGCSILQLLPMNEAGSTFCPYDAISSFALDPMYISPEGLPGASVKSIQRMIAAARKAFCARSGHVDYGIKEAKFGILRYIYAEEGIGAAKEFAKFTDENSYWLEDFALFKAIKDYHNGKPWHEWEDGYKNRDSGKLEAFRVKYEKDIVFQKWVQWVACKQFVDAKSYAESKNILLCGDLPILMSVDSADVWAHKEFFKLEFAAGAPPDMYCAKGQRWGMPTYSWKAISADGYRYLKEKLKTAGKFYDMLRVDHVVGLFRIWSIPSGEPPEFEGLNGFYDPADENRWKEHGSSILSMMCESSKMLLCAEDLGMIPKVCPETLKEFEIPGNDVQRWTKDWARRHDFLGPEEYREMSVAMLSTHDTTNWAAWWENEAGTIDEALFIRKAAERKIDYTAVRKRLFDPAGSRHGRLRWLDDIDSVDVLVKVLGKKAEEVGDFIDMYENTYHEKEKLWKNLKLKGGMKEESSPDILAAALKITLSSKSIFCIELLMDYLNMAGIFKGDPYAYRINRPGTVSKNNWSLVIPISLEELLTHKVCKEIKQMVSAAGRV